MHSVCLQGKVNGTDPVEAATFQTFKKLNLETTLSKLSRVLDTEHFALVVHNQRLCEYPFLNLQYSAATIVFNPKIF